MSLISAIGTWREAYWPILWPIFDGSKGDKRRCRSTYIPAKFVSIALPVEIAHVRAAGLMQVCTPRSFRPPASASGGKRRPDARRTESSAIWARRACAENGAAGSAPPLP